MEDWRRVWRDGIAPQLSDAGLEALRRELAEDGPLIRGDGENLVANAFKACAAALHRPDIPISYLDDCRPFLDWLDHTPRLEMRPALLPEVERELSRRR